MSESDRINRINLRRLRADRLTAQVLQIIDPYICDHMEGPPPRSAIADKLQAAFAQEGIEIISDFDRQKYGLPPRGVDGWTSEEIVAMENRRLDGLRGPVPMILPRQKKGEVA